MTEIDPMYNLINTILDDREVVIFLGGGASMEGKQDKQSFPSSDDLIDRVLQKYEVKPKNKKERIDSFFSIIEQWEKEKRLALRLREFLDGEPGLAHYYLAALSIALFGESNTLLYLTKNFDDLINQAFKDLQKNLVRKFNPVVIPIHPRLPDSEFQEIVINAEANLKRGCPVILKLFGDLNFQKPILRQDDIKFERGVEDKLIEWMAKPMIVIGYSFSDKKIRELLIASRGTSPIFIINPLRNIPPEVNDLDRIHHIKCNFSDFVNTLLEIFQERNPAINRKVDKILEFLDPTTLFPDFNSIQNRVKQCSKASKLRAEERTPKIEIDGEVKKIVPIERKDTSPDFERFAQSDRPLLVVIGDSGSGKSTLLYKISGDEYNRHFISLFYDVHGVQSAGSLINKLALDFRCEPSQLESLFEHFSKILASENKKILIIVDGLNESINIDPSILKAEIEELGSKLPKELKIIYSCRTVYWHSYIKANGPIPSALYFDSKEFLLHYYTVNESMLAFSTYKDLFEFEGDFDSLKSEFKEKIRDPLMLRMLAEGYQKDKLPKFAPAVRIFKNYEDTLKRKFKSNPFLMDFLYELISSKLERLEYKDHCSDQFIAREIRGDSRFLTYFQMLKPKDPLVLLEDEGVISVLDKDGMIYRFTYDRFFEYLLGKEIGRQFKVRTRNAFIEILSRKILLYQRFHFSFSQALKSEIVRKNIDDPNGCWSFFDSLTIKSLLNAPDAAISNFTKEVLRELTFESRINTLKVLKEAAKSELEWKLLALDIAGDSSQIKPILVEGIFSGHKHFTRRCIQILPGLYEGKIERKNFEELLIAKISEAETFKKEYAMGLIYYTSVIFSVEDQQGNDPFESVSNFWESALTSILDDIKVVKHTIANELALIVREEGVLFFGVDFSGEGMDYLWRGMTPEVCEAALNMIPLIVDEDVALDEFHQEIVRFFGSNIDDWNMKNKPDKAQFYPYKLEYRIACWILIQRGKKNFNEIKRILDDFVKTGFWLTIDFSINIMKTLLHLIYYNDPVVIEEGFEIMKRWTVELERSTEKFYGILKEEDPFSINFVPLVLTAEIDALKSRNENGPLNFVKEWLLSPIPEKVYLSLLCLRYLWRNYLQKVLDTLELALDSKDPTVSAWLDKILKEIYLVYPRQVENFFWKNNFDLSRIQAIKYRTDIVDSSGVFYEGYALYKALFLGPRQRRILVLKWYKKLLKSSSLEDFCYDLVDFLADEVSNGQDQQEID